MFVIFTSGLVLTVCVMGTRAEGCENYCENTEKVSFKAVANLGRIVSSHISAEKTEKSELTSFMVQNSASWQTGNLIDFDTVHTDAGKNFKSTMNVYIAPVNGIYFFYIEASSDNMFELGIFHEAVEVAKVDNNLQSTFVIRELAEKDAVYVKVNEAEVGGNSTLSRGKFGGFRIH